MSLEGPLEVVIKVATMLDELDIPYALGGSLAATFFGEPRSTMDVDMAIDPSAEASDHLLERASAEFVVPVASARRALLERGSFNLLSNDGGMKVDLFVLGGGALDRRQIERRVRIAVPGAPDGIWVTSPEDQVLRKLAWFRAGGAVSDRQWRDVLGILRVHGDALDESDLRDVARMVGLSELVDRALDER